MIAAAIPYILQGASMLGGIIGKKKRYIDPEYLRTHFGAEAVTKRAQELFQKIMASPYGNQLMSSAAEQGQRLQTDMGARAAASGLSPDTGGQSGASDFATSAAAGAADSIQRAGKAEVYGQAMPLAQQMVDRERELYLSNNDARNADPNLWQRIGSTAGQVASMYPPQAAAAGQTLAQKIVASAGPAGQDTSPEPLSPRGPMVPAPQPLAVAGGTVPQNSLMSSRGTYTQQPSAWQRMQETLAGRGARAMSMRRPRMSAVYGGVS